MRRLTKIDDWYEDWWLVSITHSPHWTNPIYELFAATEGGAPTHCHIYKPEEGLAKIFSRLPETVLTYSTS